MNKNAVCTTALAAALTLTSSAVSGEGSQRVIEIKAKQFDYVPSQIVLKTGEPVVLQLTSEDRVHGFNIPSLKLRADISPGHICQVRLTPQKAGDIEFFCDVFCGDGHEGMSGKLTVRD